ncbi:MAG: chorismate mutase, partial [Thalassobaculaceae bacterium]
MTNLDELRREIDGIDDQLLALLGRRIEIGRAVALSKAPDGGPFLRPG